jgi:thioesterase domain-containing protein
LNVAAQLSIPADQPDALTAPLSLQQQRFWLLDQLSSGNPACNISVRWKLIGPLDLTILKHAIAEVVRRHDVLRTHIELVAGEPVQLVQSDLIVELSRTDLRQLEPGARDAEVRRMSEVEAHQAFDLTRGPLFRVGVLRLGEDEHWMLMTAHHIIFDGWSVGTFVDEMCALYGTYAQGETSPLPELSLQYRDYAKWQKQTFNDNVSNPQLLYWLRQLKDLPRFEVPADYPRPPVQSSNGAIVSILLPRALTDTLAYLSRKRGATFFMTSLAALDVLLHRLAALDVVVVGTPVAGRTSFETEALLGLFINLLVLRSDLSGDPSFVDLLVSVRKTVLEALANQDVPFEQLVDVLKPRRDLSRNPLYQVNFIFQRAFVRQQKFGAMELIDVPSASAGALYDLNFFMVERAEGWRVSCELNTDLFRPETVVRMLDQFREIFDAIAQNPERKISELHAGLGEPGATDRNSTVNRMIPLWEQVLGVAPVGPDDDFFELGGNSLRAVRLIARIAETFDRKLPLAVIFRSTTPRALALEVDRSVGAEPAPRVIELEGVGEEPPFFMVNAFTGLIEVAKRLDSGHPILSLIGDDERALSGSYDLYEEAYEHVRTILATRAHGPYMVGGWSAGGIMAYEIAQRLESLGHHVALLVLFDTSNPFFMREYSKIETFRTRIADSVRYHRANLGRMDLIQMPAYIARKLGSRFGRKHGRRNSPSSIVDIVGESGGARTPEAFEIRIEAARRYRPLPYCGRVLLFKRSNHLSGRYLDPSFGWLGTTRGDFEVCLVRAAHLDIFSKGSRDLIARKLGVRLTEAVQDSAAAYGPAPQ